MTGYRCAGYPFVFQIEGDRHQDPLRAIKKMPAVNVSGVRPTLHQHAALPGVELLHHDLGLSPIPVSKALDREENAATAWQQMR